jgi:hypothetical protein
MQDRICALRWTSSAVAVVIAAAACQGIDAPTTPTRADSAVAVGIAPANWVGCEAGKKFTGGGWVENEGVGRVNFGFNVHGTNCATGETKGEIQVVYHANQVIVHSMTVGHFASYIDPVKGSCGEWDGTARVKHGGEWHQHHYTAEVCDKAEPGTGADRFSFYIDATGDGVHHNVTGELLRGGNIQAHDK